MFLGKEGGLFLKMENLGTIKAWGFDCGIDKDQFLGYKRKGVDYGRWMSCYCSGRR